MIKIRIRANMIVYHEQKEEGIGQLGYAGFLKNITDSSPNFITKFFRHAFGVMPSAFKICNFFVKSSKSNHKSNYPLSLKHFLLLSISVLMTIKIDLYTYLKWQNHGLTIIVILLQWSIN